SCVCATRRRPHERCVSFFSATALHSSPSFFRKTFLCLVRASRSWGSLASFVRPFLVGQGIKALGFLSFTGLHPGPAEKAI
uniref:Uncharacterized protein n=1 Tax=Aegilops tauschii subsp. strangulata TaxID=200361 RepID=A0A453HYM1_AEGTS